MIIYAIGTNIATGVAAHSLAASATADSEAGSGAEKLSDETTSTAENLNARYADRAWWPAQRGEHEWTEVSRAEVAENPANGSTGYGAYGIRICILTGHLVGATGLPVAPHRCAGTRGLHFVRRNWNLRHLAGVAD